MGKVGEILNSKPVESLTRFFAEIVGKPLVDGMGILYADAIRTRRITNTLKLEEKFNLKRSEEIESTTLAFGYKLLEKASLEENDDLLDKWANLLSNATDKNYSGNIRKIFVGILEELDPLDVKIFDDVNMFCLGQPHKYDTLVQLANINYTNKESLNVLLSLGLITYGVTEATGIQVGGVSPSQFHGLDNFKVTELGQSFYNAVNR